MILIWILPAIFIVLIFWLVLWSLIGLLVNRGARHREFVAGRLPENAPDGFYRGAAHIFFDRRTPWLGKEFVRGEAFGFNVITPQGAKILKILVPFYTGYGRNAEGNSEAFNFQTRIAKGVKDKETDVIKLDYDAPENPFLVRIILDEIVEIAPEEFLGKIHLKVFPGFYSTIGYFGLKKSDKSG